MPGVKPLGQDTNGIFSYFGYDGLGSVRELFSAGGIEQSLTNFDPYGQVLEQVSGVSSQLGFTGALTDESGFDYLNARTYDPAISNFTSADPLEGKASNPGSFNKYGYVQGDPVNMVDLSGNAVCGDSQPCQSDGGGNGPESLPKGSGNCGLSCASYYLPPNPAIGAINGLNDMVNNLAGFDVGQGLGDLADIIEQANMAAQQLADLHGLPTTATAPPIAANITKTSGSTAACILQYSLADCTGMNATHHFISSDGTDASVTVDMTDGNDPTFVSTPSGVIVAVPSNWVSRVADNGKGIIYQDPADVGENDANSIRIMDPGADSRYPNGYVRYYNQFGQPLDINGKPGSRAATHHSITGTGPFQGLP